jgi:hypothetical protein
METTKQERATWTPSPTAFDEETAWVLALCRDVDALVGLLREVLLATVEGDWVCMSAPWVSEVRAVLSDGPKE